MMALIRKNIQTEEFDFPSLCEALKTYAYPRDKITNLLKKGSIIRVKKGIYIFGKNYERRPYSREILANMIYGPSYISMDYALNYYGLIPEKVAALTCVTLGRSRRFATPVGLFIYRQIPLKAYQVGVHSITIEENRSFLIATPEKSLADKIVLDKGIDIRNQSDMADYLFKNLRMSPTDLFKLNADQLMNFSLRYRSKKLKILSHLIKKENNYHRKDPIHE